MFLLFLKQENLTRQKHGSHTQVDFACYSVLYHSIQNGTCIKTSYVVVYNKKKEKKGERIFNNSPRKSIIPSVNNLQGNPKCCLLFFYIYIIAQYI